MEKGNKIKTVVPALRFPDFQDTEGWKEYILGDFLLEQPRYGINSPAVPFQEELSTYIRITDISENGCFLPNPKVSVDHGAISDFYLKIGDLVFARTGASVGKCYKYKEKDGKLVFAGFLIKVSPDQTRLSSDFLFQFTFTQQYWKWIDLTSTRSGQPGVNSKELASMELYLPVKDEQQKIANCLSSLDELIEATAQKVEALKEHKKGLMQRLFPAEGKGVPDLRLPEFQGQATEWQSTLLGAVVDYENGRAHENEIDENGDFVVVNSKFISTDGEVIKRTNTPYCLANKEDILMVLSDVPNGRAIAKCFFVDESGKYTVNQRICRLRSKNVNSKFLFYLINRNPYFLSFDDGVKQTNLKKSEVLECPLMVPSSPIEQQKIADFLSSIDDLIIATELRIKALERHKKGLTQQLFPKI